MCRVVESEKNMFTSFYSISGFSCSKIIRSIGAIQIRVKNLCSYYWSSKVCVFLSLALLCWKALCWGLQGYCIFEATSQDPCWKYRPFSGEKKSLPDTWCIYCKAVPGWRFRPWVDVVKFSSVLPSPQPCPPPPNLAPLPTPEKIRFKNWTF
jgi:hypothetical protein